MRIFQRDSTKTKIKPGLCILRCISHNLHLYLMSYDGEKKLSRFKIYSSGRHMIIQYCKMNLSIHYCKDYSGLINVQLEEALNFLFPLNNAHYASSNRNLEIGLFGGISTRMYFLNYLQIKPKSG